jgi:hypothetical protein
MSKMFGLIPLPRQLLLEQVFQFGCNLKVSAQDQPEAALSYAQQFLQVWLALSLQLRSPLKLLPYVPKS